MLTLCQVLGLHNMVHGREFLTFTGRREIDSTVGKNDAVASPTSLLIGLSVS